jgi:short-subunit dehydrogenase
VKPLAGKVAAITGAASGIGRALAVVLAGRGCALALSDVDEVGLAETAARLPGVRVTTRRVDVAKRDQVFAWADAVVAEHGRCNLIVNNAGVALGTTAAGAKPQDFEWIVNINFWGVVHGTQAFLPHLRASGAGHVVNLSSVFGIIGVPGQSTYNATKFAVRGYTEALRQELEIEGAPVSATCVHPGGIKTNIARASRLDDSLRALGVADPATSMADFEYLFRTSPEDAAEAIVRGVERNARRVLIGVDARAIDLMQRLLPTGYQRLVSALWRRALR